MRPGRREGRLGRPAAQVLDDRGLLAGDVPAGDAGDLDRHRIDAERLAIGDRVFQAGQQIGFLAVHDQVGLIRPDRVRGQRDPIQDQMGHPGQQQPVLAASRLAFGAVGDDDRRALPGRDRAHLAAGRKAGTAPAGEPGPLDHLDQALRPLLPGAALVRGHHGQRQRPVQLLMFGQPGRVVVGDAGEQTGQPQLRRTVGGQGDRGHRAPARAAVTKRQVAAPATAAAQTIVSANTHMVSRSVPMPRPCAPSRARRPLSQCPRRLCAMPHSKRSPMG